MFDPAAVSPNNEAILGLYIKKHTPQYKEGENSDSKVLTAAWSPQVRLNRAGLCPCIIIIIIIDHT